MSVTEISLGVLSLATDWLRTFPDWLHGPLNGVHEGPPVDRAVAWCMTLVLVCGVLAPFVYRRPLTWLIAATSVIAWCVIGWWFSYMAAA